MFSPVIWILLSIWTSTYGDTVCQTLSGVTCDFPFRRTAKGPLFKTCQRGAGGRTWCATTKDATTEVYDTWGYCNPETCETWEVPSIEDAREKVEKKAVCYACIEQAAIGPPLNPSSRKCLQPCVFKPNNETCYYELLATGTRQCMEPCGYTPILDDSFLAPDGPRPACVRVGQKFDNGTALGSIQLFSAASCGNHCNGAFPTQCAVWNWNSGSAPTNRRQCVCYKGANVQTLIAQGVRSGYGPANSHNQPICPPPQ